MKNTLRRVVSMMAVVSLLAVPATAALADSPHFIRADANLSGTNLVVTFKEAGLGANVTVSITTSAFASATYACINGGQNHPKAANKETVSGQVSFTSPFTSGKNGSINGTQTLSAPGPGSFSCPSGQTLVLGSVSFTGVTVTDNTNGDSISVPGTFSATFFTF